MPGKGFNPVQSAEWHGGRRRNDYVALQCRFSIRRSICGSSQGSVDAWVGDPLAAGNGEERAVAAAGSVPDDADFDEAVRAAELRFGASLGAELLPLTDCGATTTLGTGTALGATGGRASATSERGESAVRAGEILPTSPA